MRSGVRWAVLGLAGAALVPAGLVRPVGAQEPAKLAFASGRAAAGQVHLYVMNEDGSNVKAITDGAGLAFDPAISPDGKRIAYTYMPSKEEKKAEIYVINADGTGKTQLTQLGGISIFPRWSPDGKRIAFTRAAPPDGNGPPSMKIHVMDADGKNDMELSDGWVSGWTPDGKRLLYTRMAGNEEFSIQTMEVNGANPQQLVASKAALGTLSPDGKKLAYIAEGGGNQPDVFVADADAKNPVQLTNTEDMEMGVQWSADGKRIFFNRMARGGGDENLQKMEIHAVSVDGKSSEQVTTNDAIDALASGIIIFFAR